MGALQLAFEQLKSKLEKEGLFAPERKKPIPPFPETIGIVTSLQGAAIRDMLSILRRRFEGLHIRIYPVAVQGAEAAGQIAEAILDFNAHFAETDVLLVGRGGGSLEDLWAFNEEVVARAIAGSKIPIISCVGHETDFTIADFVADLRAATPSAAAELVVQHKETVIKQLQGLTERLPVSLLNQLRHCTETLRYLAQSPTLKNPRRIYEDAMRRVDEFTGRLAQSLRQVVLHVEKDLALQNHRLQALGPLNVLARGYAIALKLPEERVILSPSEVKPKQRVKIRVHQGEFITEVLESHEPKI
jgi:exodeoxyribonuclease VII large subunit